MNFFRCSFWLRYGQLIDDSFVIMVNAFGTFLQFCYIIVFTLYSVKKALILKQFLVAVLFIIIIYLYSIIETDKELVRRQIGFLSCGLTVLFFASPLTMLVNINCFLSYKFILHTILLFSVDYH